MTTTATPWKYTAAESRAIDAAWTEITAMLDAIGNRGTGRLKDALRIERHGRAEAVNVRMVRAMLVNGFAMGMEQDLPASTVASFSEGLATAILLGADYASRRRGGKVGHYDPTPADRDRMPTLLAAAKAAHGAAWDRYIASCRG